ncbi:MAG: hypothetical protein A2W29_10160 [Gemmatimonadetes bacterium RBG_16_66_8]|nr:MAG: hypothetical protein A2W29_10160 [Gemmatimonadetes bacterium RBG_16_66_8]
MLSRHGRGGGEGGVQHHGSDWLRVGEVQRDGGAEGASVDRNALRIDAGLRREERPGGVGVPIQAVLGRRALALAIPAVIQNQQRRAPRPELAHDRRKPGHRLHVAVEPEQPRGVSSISSGDGRQEPST